MPSEDVPKKPQLFPGSFVFDDGTPMKEVWVYTDIPGDNKFKLENRWKTNARGVGGRLLESKKYNFYYTWDKKQKNWLESNLEESACTTITTGKAKSKKIEIKLKKRPRPVETFKVLKVRFSSDHNKMKDNDKDWRNTGKVFEPEWVNGKHSKPLSHTFDKEVEVEIEVEVGPEGAEAKNVKLVGKGSTAFMNFEATGIELKAGKSKHKLKSKGKIPKKVQKFANLKVAWSAEIPEHGAKKSAPDSEHLLYAIIAEPREEGRPEDGATAKRMEKGVEWVASANTLDPHKIVNHCFGKFDHYVLSWSFVSQSKLDYLKKHPDIKKQIEDDGFATFTDSSVGGAWPLAQWNEYGGECQAMVRCIRGVLTQVGCPGDAAVKYVNASADKPYTAQIRSNGTRCNGPKESQGYRYALVDSRVDKGKFYDDNSGVGWNNYEAYMRFDHDGKFGWFGGGIGKLPSTQNPLNVFYGLAEFKSKYKNGSYQREVTELWNYGNHSWGTWSG